jgi:Ca-activated chloride channel family protein
MNTSIRLNLVAGPDRALAWCEGKSVRYVVAELAAYADAAEVAELPPLNLALAIDVSGSMAGAKLEAARRTARMVTEILGPKDRLTIVAFDSRAELLLDACAMDEAGRSAASKAIDRLEERGGTDLFAGWLLAAECVALAMQASPKASHRLLLLSDGQANEGLTDRKELAGHAAGLLARGIITSAVGIGNGYDENLLGGMAEAGGGRLHDAGAATEIDEVVLGELREGRHALLDRVTLRLTLPANLRAEVVGAWTHSMLPGAVEVLAGSLLADRPKRIVFRIHCPEGEAGTPFLLGLSVGGILPDGSAAVEAAPTEVELHLARGAENNAQRRDLDRSLVVVQAWQADVLRRAVQMNRDGDRRAAGHYLERQLKLMERYAIGVPNTEALLAELVLVKRRVHEEWDERTRKGVFAMATQRSRHEHELREAAQPSIADRFGGAAGT